MKPNKQQILILALGMLTTTLHLLYANPAPAKWSYSNYYHTAKQEKATFSVLSGRGKARNLIAKDTLISSYGLVTKLQFGDGDDYQIESYQPGIGLMLHEIKFKNGDLLVFHTPLIMIPENLSFGHTYQQTAPFTIFRRGQEIDGGIQTIQVKVLGKDAALTPFKHYHGCMVLSTTTTKVLKSGPTSQIVTKQWHAPNEGLVKMAGKYIDYDKHIRNVTLNLQDVQIQR